MAELRPPYTIYVTEKVDGDHFWATYVFGFCHYGCQRTHPGRRNETRLASWARATYTAPFQLCSLETYCWIHPITEFPTSAGRPSPAGE